MAERKKRAKNISRREFLVDAGLMASGAAIGSIAFLMSCRATEKTVTQTVTETIKDPSTTNTLQTAANMVSTSTSTPLPSFTSEPSLIPTTNIPTPSQIPTPTPKPSVPLKPASFVLGDLTITPTAIMVGEQVTYSIQVSNTGGTEGSYTVVFKYKSSGGSIGSDNVEVNLKPGETKTATLTTTQNYEGTVFVNVNDKSSQYTVRPVPTPIYGVPSTSASAVTSPPSSMVGINTHPEVYGTDADPNMITLGPKLGAHPAWTAYPGKVGMEFELKHGTPVFAPIDMVLIGVNNKGFESIQSNGQKVSPCNDLNLFFESANPDWPKMIIFIYHLLSSPLVLKDSQNEVEDWTILRAQGHLFYAESDYIAPANAISCDAMIGRSVRRGELIAFAGSVGTHSMAPFCFKVSHTSINPTVKTGNPYLHWVQPSSFFYWKSYRPEAVFPSGVLAYPFECDGYQLPLEQHDVNFKYPLTVK